VGRMMEHTHTHASRENGRHLSTAHDAITHIAATYDGGVGRGEGSGRGDGVRNNKMLDLGGRDGTRGVDPDVD